jgi:hypothetical protein
MLENGRAVKFIWGTLLLYIALPAITRIPGLPSLAFIPLTVLFLVFWLGFPYAFHKDKQYVQERYEWEPSKLYYLGVLPSIIGIVFVLGYLYEREKKAK